jgi:hypothetical protein
VLWRGDEVLDSIDGFRILMWGIRLRIFLPCRRSEGLDGTACFVTGPYLYRVFSLARGLLRVYDLIWSYLTLYLTILEFGTGSTP